MKKRALKVTLEKTPQTPDDPAKDSRSFEQKVDIVRHEVEKVVVKAFMGICVYVVFDTCRQVIVSKTSN